MAGQELNTNTRGQEGEKQSSTTKRIHLDDTKLVINLRFKDTIDINQIGR